MSLVHDGVMHATRVLVVDDEPMVREVLARYLQKEGFAVDVAEDGEAALATYEAAHPDLVLLDLMLPKVDGLEVFRRMRASAPAAVIMLTAKGEETERSARGRRRPRRAHAAQGRLDGPARTDR